MPKFAVQSAVEFRSNLRNQARVTRYREMQGHLKFVVTVEADDGSWFELDADDLPHAKRLAHCQVDTMSARGASVWGFNATTGKLSNKSSYAYFWQPDPKAEG